MSNGYTCCIDKERINSSIRTLNSVEDCINNRSLSNNFIEIEEVIKNTNFYHNNCIRDYKEKIDYALFELESIKREINKLNTVLSKTITEFSQAEELRSNDVDNIFNNFDCKVDTSNLSVNNNLKVAHNTTEFRENMNILKNSMNLNNDLIEKTNTTVAEITNTVPIGLGIGATGIAVSAGAVVLDSMKNKEKENNKEEVEEEKHEEVIEPKKEEEIITPYFANRDKTKIDKFYDD